MSAAELDKTLCDQHPSGEILQPAEIIQAFGPTAGSLMPVWPGYGRLRTETKDAVFLSRLACGHYLMTSPTTVAAAEKKANAAAVKPTALQVSRLTYQRLLEKAHAGEEVTAAEVSHAQAAIMVEEQAEAGRKERQEAARIKAERELREALEGPVRDELAESRAIVQEATDSAYRALMALLDAVDDDMGVQNSAVAALLAGGFEQAEVRPPANYLGHRTVAAGESFPYFPKMEHLIAVLHQVQHSRHRNSFFSVNGRDLGRAIPAPIAKGPRVSPGAEEET